MFLHHLRRAGHADHRHRRVDPTPKIAVLLSLFRSYTSILRKPDQRHAVRKTETMSLAIHNLNPLLKELNDALLLEDVAPVALWTYGKGLDYTRLDPKGAK